MKDTLTLMPHERLKMLRNGEIVLCTHCKVGIMQPIGDAVKTNTFQCNKCKRQMIFN
ncbi:hypothetical protein [Velocimicrobium porci]|uniref:hypothetical protein n=1 Tax=Velocimicrobium porci TaxID=2606634 RepID=UPI0012B1C53E|nr:hypothetical protein [Velocimicrobium porci]